MAFKQKILEINQEFKDWLTATFASKSHNHASLYYSRDEVDSMLASMGGAEPDFTRAYTFWHPASMWSFKQRIFKVNVPGYIMIVQTRANADVDHVIYVARHPGYFNYSDVASQLLWTTHKAQESSARTVPTYMAERAVFAGASIPGGDHWNSFTHPINPGLNTYIAPCIEHSSYAGYEYHYWVFVPCKKVPTGISKTNYVTCVGMSAQPSTYNENTNRGLISNDMITTAFTGNWINNFTVSGSSYTLRTSGIKYIDTVFIRSSNWGWDNYNSGNDGSLGRRFFMFDACATGSNRRWLAYNDWRHQLYYDTTRKCWALTYGWDTYYEAPDADGTGDPWSLTWKTGPANSSYTTMPVLTMQRYN